jgi:hypothetical protein
MTGITIDTRELRGLRVVFAQDGSKPAQVTIRKPSGPAPKLNVCRVDESDHPGVDCVAATLQDDGSFRAQIDLGCACRSGVEISNARKRLARFLDIDITYAPADAFLSVLLPPHEPRR